VYRTAWAWLIHCGDCDRLVAIEASEARADQSVDEHIADDAHILAKFTNEVDAL
jgi:hypothetical protein